MKLYHGTNEVAAKEILREGIKPRGITGINNWVHCSSHEKMVYLTKCYAPYFAINALNSIDCKLAIVEIETDGLEIKRLMPDEDAIEQSIRSDDKTLIKFGIYEKSLKERTEWIRNNIKDFQHYWDISLDLIGNCAYMGTIPKENITKIVLHGNSNPKMLVEVVEPTITTMNYKIMGKWYEKLNKWFAGYPVEAEDLLSSSLTYLNLDSESKKLMVEKWKMALINTKGMEVLFNSNKV